MRFPLTVIALIVVGALAPADAPDPKPASHPLVAVQEGKLPILISAPHGGAADVPGAEPRKGEGFVKGSTGFFVGRDTGTEELAYAIAKAVESKLHAKPYFVVAKSHRKYADFNRPVEIGVEGPKARPVYDAYHQTLAAYCRAVQKEFGRGLLIDVHGQGSAADTVFRGTKDGKTVELLIKRFGDRAHTGPDSFFGLLKQAGCKIYPEEPGVKERAGFTGGYIVQTYGSHTAFGIDAIQLEFGGQYRKKDVIEDTASKVTSAIVEYRKKYLPEKAVGAGK